MLKTACVKQEAPESGFLWTIGSIMKKGQKGSWYNTTIELKGFVDPKQFEQAQKVLSDHSESLVLEEKAASVNI